MCRERWRARKLAELGVFAFDPALVCCRGQTAARARSKPNTCETTPKKARGKEVCTARCGLRDPRSEGCQLFDPFQAEKGHVGLETAARHKAMTLERNAAAGACRGSRVLQLVLCKTSVRLDNSRAKRPSSPPSSRTAPSKAPIKRELGQQMLCEGYDVLLLSCAVACPSCCTLKATASL